MKAIFINGSPRKNKNTAQMLESAMKDAQEAGAEVEMIQLYGLNYKGCPVSGTSVAGKSPLFVLFPRVPRADFFPSVFSRR